MEQQTNGNIVKFENTNLLPNQYSIDENYINNLAESVYGKFDRLLVLCNEIVEDIKERIAINPNLVEMQENAWLYSIMSAIPDDARINYIKDNLKKFDDLINTQWKEKQQ
jgi:hypothetical protein